MLTDPQRKTERQAFMFEVRSWHILLMLAAQLIGLGVVYGRITEKQDNFSRDLQRIEGQRTITKDEFDEWRAQLINRLDRMENKLDSDYLKKGLR